MNRVKKFHGLSDHPWYHRFINNLTGVEKEIALNFIQQNASLDKDDYAMKVERMFLDKSSKPKRWKEIQELLLVSNQEDRK